MNDELKIGVQVSSDAPGVTPVAFVALVEVIDADGEKQFVTVESNGLTPQRRAAITERLNT